MIQVSVELVNIVLNLLTANVTRNLLVRMRLNTLKALLPVANFVFLPMELAKSM